ncbi:MAG: hypothetical protein HZB14_10850 [Actinobacteria bacterium]|nr:hypothetical protein [Actinomycetota bacterium]
MNAHERAAAAAVTAAKQSEFARLYGHLLVEGGTERFYDRICDHLGFPGQVSPALLGHFAGPTEGGWEVIDVWPEEHAMEHVFSRYLVDAVSAAMQQTGERFDVEPEMREIARLVVGPSAARYSLDKGAREKSALRGVRPIGALIENLGGGEEEYLLGCKLLGFPEHVPDGLVLHIAGECDDGWRTFDCWNSAEQCDAWFAHVAEAIKTVDGGTGTMSQARFRRIELVRAFVNPHLTGGGYLAV